MKYAIVALTALLFSGCLAVGHRHETCPYGIGVPFVFVGINGEPLGLCR